MGSQWTFSSPFVGAVLSLRVLQSINRYFSGILEFPVYVYKEVDLISSGGIEVRNLRASAIARKKPLGEPVLEKFQFIPHISVEVGFSLDYFRNTNFR